MDEGSLPHEEPSPAPQVGARRRTPQRRMILIPGLARRGRTTIRHFTLLLLGGYVAWVERRRSRGASGMMFRLQAMIALVCRVFLSSEMAALPFPVQLRRRLEILGPTYVKLGQILSLRLDVLPEVVTRELQNLLSRLPEVAFDEIRGVIERDLGRSLEELFAEIDPEPVGSASIAQIHRALTHDGRRVILKVVKPGIRELLYRDATLLRFFSRFLQLVIPRYQPRRMVEEFFDYTLQEIEMTREAEHAETFAANFRDLPGIVFPGVYREYSGSRVLCMDYLEGRRPEVAVVQGMSDEERQQLLDLGAAAILRMLYEDGYFHADLHPGNLIILPDNRVGFIDLGMVGRLEPELRHHLLFLFYSVVMEDFDNAARHLSSVAHTEIRSDVLGFRRSVKELCRKWRRAATLEDFSLAQLILESVRLGARYKMYFPVEMVLMVKALVTYEGVGYLFDPEFNVITVSQRHVNRIFRAQLSPMRLFREGLRGAPDLVDAVVKLPILISESVRLLEERSLRRPESPVRGLRGTLLGGFLILSGTILAALEGPMALWIALLACGVIIALRRGTSA
jgi:ubiquinone biosynthesis protein